MLIFQFLIMAALSAGSTSSTGIAAGHAPRISDVKTTAYTHTESDHLKHGTATAAGGTLRYGAVRSAAADWSVYPVGTVFKIEGDKHLYEVDDYGSALVGTKTIDLYKPCKDSMNRWGSRKVDIQIIKWGCSARSLAILKPRIHAAPHIAQMIRKLQGKTTG